MFTVSTSAGSGMAVKGLLDSSGVAAFVDRESGRTVVVTHGTPDGHLPCLRAEHGFVLGAIVICCYPAAVKARYPHLTVAGSWTCKTTMAAHGDTFSFYPERVA